jgi:hypothetical protein
MNPSIVHDTAAGSGGDHAGGFVAGTRAAAARPDRDHESGMVLVAYLSVLFLLVGIAGAAMMAMGGRNSRLLAEVQREKALLATEAGIDAGLYRATTGLLVDGVSFGRVLPGGASYTADPVHLGVDGVDNDGDGKVDEFDEDVFQLTVLGTFGKARRRVVAYLSRANQLPPLAAAVTLFHPNPKVRLDFDGSGFLGGADTDIDGGAGPGAPVAGLAIQAPATIADLTGDFLVDDPTRITGLGASPSLAVSDIALDFGQITFDVQNNADMTLSGSYYHGVSAGSGPAETFYVIYRNGNLTLEGTCVGAGVLLVTGDLDAHGTLFFDGLVIVLGDVSFRHNVRIQGALIQGPAGARFETDDDTRIRWSREALLAATQALGYAGGDYTVLSGWQEVSHH